LKSEAWGEGMEVVLLLALGNIFLGIYYNMSIWYKLTNKNLYGAALTIGGAVLTIVLNILLIPTFHYWGAAAATFCCYLFMMGASYLLGQKHYPVPSDVKKIASYLLFVVFLVVFHRFLVSKYEPLWFSLTSGTAFVLLFIFVTAKKEKQELKNRAMTYFPELFGNSSDKFGRLAIWLVTREAVVCPNVRDLFTAGGKSDYLIGKKTYHKVPRIFLNLFDNVPSIVETIVNTSAFELSEYWETKTTEKNKLFDWIELVAEHSKKIQDAKHLNIKQILTDLALK
jgi:hypothetical protein